MLEYAFSAVFAVALMGVALILFVTIKQSIGVWPAIAFLLLFVAVLWIPLLKIWKQP